MSEKSGVGQRMWRERLPQHVCPVQFGGRALTGNQALEMLKQSAAVPDETTVEVNQAQELAKIGDRRWFGKSRMAWTLLKKGRMPVVSSRCPRESRAGTPNSLFVTLMITPLAAKCSRRMRRW